ncbi:hypothetical protein B0T22DRAFT_378099 [Podospora appendiculata]|uniref:Nephrocystin 3-like N-terminal domain-containing protein n=1 Tax=Podospora appendiculata TaxID=314037 RepID=A0AAE0XDE3_9PEZI|nr:hypothetical protein B0T22DRAFT_378099 [Podospora appendiculata]
MDPFVAVGLASSIVAFLDFGFKVVKAARAIQESVTSGTTSQDEDLAFLSEKIKGLAIDLQPATPESQMTSDEVRLGELAKTCTRLSDDLLKLIGKLQPANPTSKRQLLRTALRAQLHLQLSYMSKSELQSRLDQVITTGNCQQGELASLLRNVQALQQGVTVTSLGPDVLDQLSSLLRSTTRALDKTLQSRVMDPLYFKTMNNRFEEVETAHEQTFNWILGPSGNSPGSYDDSDSDNDSNSDSQEKARADFVTWLTEGHGIFHITGKPGSGKSTLMKYLCQHPQTRSFLETWAAPKQLITANFFFWKPGSPLQKSMNGLLRALLYCLLEQAPDLIPTCLPVQWNAAHGHSESITLSTSDVQDALDRLVTNPTVYQNHKFVFFIDGLDEFKGNHDLMTKRLLNWASTSSTNLKICVSSREWLVFQQRLAHCPSMRLHDLTSRDIRGLILATLEANEEFQELSKTARPDRLVDALHFKSEGVFLWVTLVLRMIEQALLTDDGMDDLLKKIQTTPAELECLYEQLFNSVLNEGHPIDQQFALKILRLLSFVPGSKGNGSSTPARDLELLDCLFLDDFDKNPRFAFSLPCGHDFKPDIESR